MRLRRIIGGAIAVGLIGWLVLSTWQARTALHPPALAFVSGEPAGMVDGSGAELLLVDFTFNNPNPTNQLKIRANTIYVKDAVQVIEARIGNHWNNVRGTTAIISREVGLAPGQQYQSQLLVPVGTDSCRVLMTYAGPATSLSLKGVSQSIVLRLPLFIRSRISYKFWRWVGFPESGPSANWRQVCVELLLPPTSSQSANPDSGDAHNQSLELLPVCAQIANAAAGRAQVNSSRWVKGIS